MNNNKQEKRAKPPTHRATFSQVLCLAHSYRGCRRGVGGLRLMDHHSREARHSHAVPVFCRRATMALRTEHKGVGNRCPRVAHHDVCGIGCCRLQQAVFCFRKAPIVLPTMGCPALCLCRGTCLRCHDKSSYACASCSSAERNRPLVSEQLFHKHRATARHPCYHLLFDLRVGLRNRARS